MFSHSRTHALPLYRTCIFCSAKLGSNEAIEEFPVGRGLAFDPWKGRLWAVCSACGRWNLAPIEERWEATESAEKLFRDSRLRVHSENIGLAKLPDGTRLIRVGDALPREFAAWRYGDQLVRRRKQALLWGGVGVAATATVMVGGLALAGAAAAAPLFHLAVNGGSLVNVIRMQRSQGALVHRVPAESSPSGKELTVTVGHLFYAQMVPDPEDRGVALRVPTLLPPERVEDGAVVRWVPPPPVLIRGADAERVVAKLMVRANARGANPRQLDRALNRLADVESRDVFLRRIGEREAGLFPASFLNPPGNTNNQPLRIPDVKGAWHRFKGTFRGERIAGGSFPVVPRRISAEEALALEMALHEESERRALEGELGALEAAWRDAEEIAAIADVLPDDPLERLAPDE